MTVTTVENEMLPKSVQTLDGLVWAEFGYDTEQIPWKFPKLIMLDGVKLQWSCYNSDRMVVVYKQCTSPTAKVIYGSR